MATKTYKEGDTITFKASGKVSRLDGVAGTHVKGVIVYVDTANNEVHVEKLYESLVENAAVPFEQIIS